LYDGFALNNGKLSLCPLHRHLFQIYFPNHANTSSSWAIYCSEAICRFCDVESITKVVSVSSSCCCEFDLSSGDVIGRFTQTLCVLNKVNNATYKLEMASIFPLTSNVILLVFANLHHSKML